MTMLETLRSIKVGKTETLPVSRLRYIRNQVCVLKKLGRLYETRVVGDGVKVWRLQ